MSCQALFNPYQFKSLNLRNRLVMAPMTRTQSPGGIPTQEVVDYYSRRAKAEVGLIISEGTVVARPAAANHPDIPEFHGKALPMWQEVIRAVHENQGQMAPQIWHVGKVSYPDPKVKIEQSPEGPDTMSIEDIEATIAAFAQAALDAKNLGFDCVEIHGAHGYLIDQFFWQETNKRDDAFGGRSLAERSRFAIEVVKAIRAAVGPDLAVILRLSQWKQQDYKAKLALTPQEMEAWLKPLAEAGVDIFHCSQRRFWEPEFENSDLNFAGWAKKITGCPTITVGSVGLSGDFLAAFKGQGSDTHNLDELMKRFDRGDFDLVAVGRALLQDPEWVLKVKEGRDSEIKAFSPESLGKLY